MEIQEAAHRTPENNCTESGFSGLLWSYNISPKAFYRWENTRQITKIHPSKMMKILSDQITTRIALKFLVSFWGLNMALTWYNTTQVITQAE